MYCIATHMKLVHVIKIGEYGTTRPRCEAEQQVKNEKQVVTNLGFQSFHRNHHRSFCWDPGLYCPG